MKKTMLVMAMVIALAMSTMAGAIAEDHDPGITSPTAAEVVYENTLNLTGTDTAAKDNNARWAVRGPDACSSNNTEAGNVDGENDDFAWEGGDFTATVDITGWDSGEYCFVLNTEQGGADGSRLIQNFYIVDDYVVVDASIDKALNSYDPDTGKPDYSVSGVVGLYGTEGLAGELELRYHNPKISCQVDLTTGTAQLARYGPDPDAARLQMKDVAYDCNNGDAGEFALIQILEPGFEGPNGATFVSEGGGVSGDGDYDLVGTFDESRDWVPLDRGEADFNIAAFS